MIIKTIVLLGLLGLSANYFAASDKPRAKYILALIVAVWFGLILALYFPGIFSLPRLYFDSLWFWE